MLINTLKTGTIHAVTRERTRKQKPTGEFLIVFFSFSFLLILVSHLLVKTGGLA